MIAVVYLLLWLCCFGITKWYYDGLRTDKDLSIQQFIAPWVLFVAACFVIELIK